MKKILSAALLSATLLASPVFADTLPLPRGNALDLGSHIDVWEGSTSFTGRMLREMLSRPDLEAELNRGFIGTGMFSDDPEAREKMVSLTVKLIKETKFYQLRSAKTDAFYNVAVISVPLSFEDEKELSSLGKKIEADLSEKREILEEAFTEETVLEEKPLSLREKKEKQKREERLLSILEKAKMKRQDLPEPKAPGIPLPLNNDFAFYIGKKSPVKEGKMKDGRTYRMESANLGIYGNGFFFPFFAEVLEIKDKDGAVYTVFMGDQKSGEYFVPYIKKAVKGRK